MARFTRADKRDEHDIRELVFALIENRYGELDHWNNFIDWCKAMAEVGFDRTLDGEPLPKIVTTITPGGGGGEGK